jgi:hypothetical protein
METQLNLYWLSPLFLYGLELVFTSITFDKEHATTGEG